jgi:hypothetical protein
MLIKLVQVLKVEMWEMFVVGHLAGLDGVKKKIQYFIIVHRRGLPFQRRRLWRGKAAGFPKKLCPLYATPIPPGCKYSPYALFPLPYAKLQRYIVWSAHHPDTLNPSIPQWRR